MPLTGRQLKAAVAAIPDDAEVFVAGMSDIWDWAFFEGVEVTPPNEKDRNTHWQVMGVDAPEDNNKEQED